MPHCDLHYSADLALEVEPLLARIEAAILAQDAEAGATKGRAYPAAVFHHTHLKVTIALLAKPHRDAAFVSALQAALKETLAPGLPRPCWLSIDIVFSTPFYVTEYLE